MSKKKIKRRIFFPTEFVMDDIKYHATGEIIQTVNKFLSMEDGSELSQKHIDEIIQVFIQHSDIISLICSAYEEKGYDSF